MTQSDAALAPVSAGFDQGKLTGGYKVEGKELSIEIEVLEERIAPTANGSLSYEGQPGNQGNGLRGYEGHPGNQGGH